MNDGGLSSGEESHYNSSSGGSPVDDVACTSVSPFSYAELGEMLKQIPPASDVALPLARMFEAAEMVYLIPLDFSCHTGVFFTRLVIELVVVGFSTAG